MHISRDKIVVFREYPNTIEAYIAKSKLDVNGVPCFLTEENINNLYPDYAYNVLNMGIRLHIFEEDRERAMSVFEESRMHVHTDASGACPKCASFEVERDFPKKFQLKPLTAIAVLIFGIFIPHQKVFRCLSCEHEFH